MKTNKQKKEINPCLQSAINKGLFDLDGFVNEYSKINPELMKDPFGRSFLLQILNSAAQESWSNDIFYQEKMISEVAKYVPGVDEFTVSMYCSANFLELNSPTMLVDCYQTKQPQKSSYEKRKADKQKENTPPTIVVAKRKKTAPVEEDLER